MLLGIRRSLSIEVLVEVVKYSTLQPGILETGLISIKLLRVADKSQDFYIGQVLKNNNQSISHFIQLIFMGFQLSVFYILLLSFSSVYCIVLPHIIRNLKERHSWHFYKACLNTINKIYQNIVINRCIILQTVFNAITNFRSLHYILGFESFNHYFFAFFPYFLGTFQDQLKWLNFI